MDLTGESPGTMRAVADRGACCGYGVCHDICPEVFKLDEAGLVYLENDIVPAELVESAKEAAESCPQLALRVEPIEG
ncbi:MAG: 4Fe-4S single cluster domain protein [Alphaproteobacteria bacterium]|nr:4Fe-4S single cluster domain protein [Alphaproteobacteria bacterium]